MLNNLPFRLSHSLVEFMKRININFPHGINQYSANRNNIGDLVCDKIGPYI